jgi:FtsP/CotA-like multicopper oxidase with cupredoxin domain
VAPIWNPEFFGNTLVVNGRTWPKLEVEPRKYRFRFLNGSDARFLILRFAGEQISFNQIGADQGFLPAPVVQKRLLLGPAERADVIVDFSSLKPGTRIILQNIGPDEPFGGGTPSADGCSPADDDGCFASADPGTTGKVMAFDVVPATSRDFSRIPATLPAEGPLPTSGVTRTLSLNEEESSVVCVVADSSGNVVAADCGAEGAVPFGPTAAKLGTLNPDDGTSTPLMWADKITENPKLGATETWEIYNFTADAHPIHLHLVRFKVLDRQALATDADGIATQPAELVGAAKPPEAWEVGYKDTVIAYPGEVTRIAATFDIPGLYVWHCHIIEHEDNEMMRPYCVGGQDTCPVPIAVP